MRNLVSRLDPCSSQNVSEFVMDICNVHRSGLGRYLFRCLGLWEE